MLMPDINNGLQTPWKKLITAAGDAAYQIETNPRQFVKDHGMKISSLTFAGVNVYFITKGLFHPEQVNWIRNYVAAPLQIGFGYQMANGNKKRGYDWGVGGGGTHVAANIGEMGFFNALTRGIFTEASYRESDWPQRVKNLEARYPRLTKKFAEARDEIAHTSLAKGLSHLTYNVRAFVDDKFPLLHDPHARAGTTSFLMTIAQATEAVIQHNERLLPIMPYWGVASIFYMTHGLFHAADNRKQQKLKQPIPS